MEDQVTEWKESWKDDYLKQIASFCNTEGGVMTIGIRDDGSVCGVSSPRRLLEKLPVLFREKLSVVNASFSIIELDGRECVRIEVPKASKMVDLDGRFYYRSGSTTHRISGEELKDLILEERNTDRMDLPTELTPTDVSPDAIGYFVSLGKEAHRVPESVDGSDVTRVLDSQGLLSEDGRVTCAGALLFSENPRRWNDGAFLKIGEFDERSHILRERYITAPLVKVPNMALDVLFDSFVPSRFAIGNDWVRRPVDRYPRKAVRELIVNAIVHKDYRIEEPVTVSVFPDRLEVFCFGGLPKGWTPDMLKKPHPSRPRNRRIANVFHEAGYFENWAQGIRMVMDLCEENGNPEPDFEIRIDGLVAIMYPTPKCDEPEPVEPEPVESAPALTERQKVVIGILREDPYASAKDIAARIGVVERSVYRILTELESLGVIVKIGARRNRRYDVLLKDD